jgi:hypothetical protein
MALFVWGFAALWLAMLALMTWVLFTKGPPEGYSMPVTAMIMGVFWIAGAGLAAYVAAKPCIRVRVGRGGRVEIVHRYPLRRVRRTVPASQVGAATVVESKDSDGDPYFHARITLDGSAPVDIAEGHDRAACERVCERFNRAIDPWH